jgi:predicted Zn-dependent peptidase
LELLVKFVQSPYLTDENVEKEKGIISQEIKMYDDDPGWRVFFNCLRSMYVNHPIRIDIAGTVESINTITKELLYKAYNTFYNPSNMVLFIIGDLSFEKIIDVVKSSEKKFEKKEENIKRIYTDEPKEINEKFIEEKMVTSTPLFYIGFKDSDLNLMGKDAVKKDLITNIILDLLFSPSSLFYNELYNEGLITSNFGAYFTGKRTYGHSLVIGESHKPKIVYEKVLNLIDKRGEEVLKLEDFNRIKNKNLGNFLMGLNSIEFIANNFVDLYFDNFIILDYLDVMEEIQYNDILKRFKNHFTRGNVVLSIINPI